jgi:hypothetical protein
MGTTNREALDKIITDHFLYEAIDDIEGVLRTFTEDAEHELVGGPDGPLKGKTVLCRFYERLFRDLKGERVEPVMRLYGNDFVIDETIWPMAARSNWTARAARRISGFCMSSSCATGLSPRKTSGLISTSSSVSM